MTRIFSKRYRKVLEEKKLKVSIPRVVRMRLWNLLDEFKDKALPLGEKTETGFFHWKDIFDELVKDIKYEHGLEELLAYSEEKKGSIEPTDLRGSILRGIYPPFVWDTVELFFSYLLQEYQVEFQKKFNQIMEEDNLNWRMDNGKIFPVDSIYIEKEIMQKTYHLLGKVEFWGALKEFEKAREDLVNGDYEGAIQNANLAVESTIKYVLNIKKARPGQLFKQLIDSKLIPDYYSGFLKSFEENILRAVAIIRNEEPGAGHGRGGESNPIPKSLAELAVNLSGVLIKYLIERYLEKQLE